MERSEDSASERLSGILAFQFGIPLLGLTRNDSAALADCFFEQISVIHFDCSSRVTNQACSLEHTRRNGRTRPACPKRGLLQHC
jgi:hypothetical protein